MDDIGQHVINQQVNFSYTQGHNIRDLRTGRETRKLQSTLGR